jgi:hypothetical protein
MNYPVMHTETMQLENTGRRMFAGVAQCQRMRISPIRHTTATLEKRGEAHGHLFAIQFIVAHTRTSHNVQPRPRTHLTLPADLQTM